MEAFGKVHPSHRNYSQWEQMTEKERKLHRKYMSEVFIKIAETFSHSAIFIHPNPYTLEEIIYIIDTISEMVGNKYFLMIHGDATFSIPYGDKVCLIGNVNCGLLQTGTDEEVIESCLYALKNGMPGYGYIFSTSNCIYTGVPLERYKLMLSIWEKYGNYD